MANPYVLDFSGPQNMLARYHKAQMEQRGMDQQQGQFEQSNMLARERMGQDARQFGMSHALSQRSADRADQMAPGQLELQKAQIGQAMSQARSEAELRPLMMEHKRIELELARAKAAGKDAETLMLQSIMGTGPQQQPAPQAPPQQPGYAPGIRPQKFDGAPQQRMAPMPMPVADAGGPMNALAPQPDASLILAQSAPQPAPQPQQPPSARDVMQNMTPAQRAQFGMAWAGKGDAAKVLGEAANVQQLGKDVRGDVDKKELAAVETIARVKDIARAYKPEFLTYEGKAKQYAVSWADSFDATRKKLPPDVIREHGEYVEFRRNAVSSMNNYIKEMTGAAMSEQEAARLRKAIADAENDSPIAFERKLKSMSREAEMTVGRMRMLRRDGFQGQPWNGDAERAAATLPLPQFQRMIESDTRRLYQDMRQQNPNADDAQIKGAVRQRIRTKYGIDA